jgi:hypothetical protein
MSTADELAAALDRLDKAAVANARMSVAANADKTFREISIGELFSLKHEYNEAFNAAVAATLAHRKEHP